MGPGTFPSAGLLAPAAPASSSGAPGGSINWRGLYDAAAADLADARDAFIRAFQTAAGMRDNYTLGEGDTDAGARGEVRGPSAMSLAGLGMTGAAPGGLLAAPRGGAVLGAGPIRGYHASPYDFERFDIAKIGTGEGSQAFGHGLYVAENKGVAQGYRDSLAPKVDPRDGIKNMLDNLGLGSTRADIEGAAAGLGLQLHDKQIADIAIAVRGRNADGSMTAPAIDALRRLDGSLPITGGRMYEVAIHADPKRFLDWDKKLVDQPEVRDSLRRAGFISPQGKYEAFVANAPAYGGDILHALQGGASQGSLRLAGTPEKAARFLSDAGIPGVRYLDALSRGGARGESVGPGTHNYAVFDDKLIEILRKYGMLPAAIGGGAAAAAQPVGLLEQ